MKLTPHSTAAGRRVLGPVSVPCTPCPHQQRQPRRSTPLVSTAAAARWVPGKVGLGALQQQARTSRNTNREVVTQVSHNDGLEVSRATEKQLGRYCRNSVLLLLLFRQPKTVNNPSPPAPACAAVPDVWCRPHTLGRCHSARSWQQTAARSPSGCSAREQSWACARWVSSSRKACVWSCACANSTSSVDERVGEA